MLCCYGLSCAANVIDTISLESRTGTVGLAASGDKGQKMNLSTFEYAVRQLIEKSLHVSDGVNQVCVHLPLEEGAPNQWEKHFTCCGSRHGRVLFPYINLLPTFYFGFVHNHHHHLLFL